MLSAACDARAGLGLLVTAVAARAALQVPVPGRLTRPRGAGPQHLVSPQVWGAGGAVWPCLPWLVAITESTESTESKVVSSR